MVVARADNACKASGAILQRPRGTYIAEVIRIIEQNAKCGKCGQRAIEVVSYEEKHLKCTNCGFEKKAEKDEEKNACRTR